MCYLTGLQWSDKPTCIYERNADDTCEFNVKIFYNSQLKTRHAPDYVCVWKLLKNSQAIDSIVYDIAFPF